LDLITELRDKDGRLDASPGALRNLRLRAAGDAELQKKIDEATTREPLRPTLNRALVDAWSMTSLETHTGRPDVAPWLRGWVDDKPQTTIVWRTHLPVRIDERAGRHMLPGRKEIDDFFEAAPPHESEKLETETYRVVDWLQERAQILLKRKPHTPEGREQEDEELGPDASAFDVADGEPSARTTLQASNLRRDEIVALSLSSSNAYMGRYTLGDLRKERKGRSKEDVHDELVGRILVVDARFGGLKGGLLGAASDDAFETADDAQVWSKEAQFRVRRITRGADDEWPIEAQEAGWRFEDDFDLRRNEEGKALERLVVEHFEDAAQKEDSRSISKPQELSLHQEWARREMMRITKSVSLPDIAADALAIGASLHDEGKKALRWQRAFKAPRVKDEHGVFKVFAKTRGPIDQAILGGYRHEFGSLPYLEKNEKFQRVAERLARICPASRRRTPRLGTACDRNARLR
jgi:CRISPR-associated endonuclease/helicase Cas3